MKIMHLSSEYPPTQVFGLGRAVNDLAVAQAALGHEVHVVTNSLGGCDPDSLMDGVWVHRIHFPPPPKPPDDTTAVIQFNVLLVQKACELLRSGLAPEVIHVHDWLTVLAGRSVKHLHPNSLLAVTIHDTAHGKYFGRLSPPNQYISFLERYVGAEAELVICCSEHVRQELTQEYQVPSEKIGIIPCGVDAERFVVDVDVEGFLCLFADPGDKVILYVGRLDQEKGLPHLLEALARLLLVVPQARLVIAGKGVLHQRLLESAHELGISDRISFTGYVEGEVLAALYHSCHVVAVPSLYEPFGIVALEGMICGRPIVASAIGGLREIVLDGQTGLTVPPADAVALAGALLKVLTSDELAVKLGDQGRQRAERLYSWTHVARQTIKEYAGMQPGGTREPCSCEISR
ncbi:MAG: glycosyltransferase family 4 protein [Armatimonadia bacterium]